MRDNPYSSRPDVHSADVVEQGLSLVNTHGRAVASAFLESGKIPFSVIARVISEPVWRRRSNKHVAHEMIRKM
ncbi:hypothetical protein HSX11_09810 [Oxalobacteraceae bacterium]|nr:hypothetical protein [Oxalobacteraceae bacterium]